MLLPNSTLIHKHAIFQKIYQKSTIITCITTLKNVSARKDKALRSLSHFISPSRRMKLVILVSLNRAARALSTPAGSERPALPRLGPPLLHSSLCQALPLSQAGHSRVFELCHTCVVLGSVLFLTCLLTVLIGSQLCIMLFTYFLITSLLASPGCRQWICCPCSGIQVIDKFGFQ